MASPLGRHWFAGCRSVCLRFAFLVLTVRVRLARAGSNPLSWTPWWQETSHEYVTVVKKSGAIQPHPLLPGLHFTPWALMGETYTPVKIIPDTDCYKPIEATTMDFIKYKVGVCVTNLVDSSNAVTVVSKLGFDYDTVALRIQADNSIKEMLMTYTWLDVEKHKANRLNEDIAKKISQELVEKFGDVGGMIKVLGVTIKEKTCQSPELVKELQKQAEHQAQTATEKLRMDREQAKEATETAKVRAQEERAEVVRKAAAERQLATIKADNERQDLTNAQLLKNAENKAAVARAEANSEVERRKSLADLIEKYPGFAQHERAIEYSRALSDKAKFVLSDSVNSQMQGTLAAGNALSWLFGPSRSGAPSAESCTGGTCNSIPGTEA